MAVLHSPESAYAKEAVKWEAQHTSMGPPGRPYVKYDFPTMLHRAARPPKGGDPEIVEQVTVESDRQLPYFESRGFRHTPLEAIDYIVAQEREFATLAAEREFDVKHKLSPAAVAEVRAAEAEVSGHLPVVPETPVQQSQEKKRRAAAKKAAATTEKETH